jgi:hypothetical protein
MQGQPNGLSRFSLKQYEQHIAQHGDKRKYQQAAKNRPLKMVGVVLADIVGKNKRDNKGGTEDSI